MKIITEPKVTVISVPHFLEHPEYKIPADGDEITRLCAFAAKGCYDSYGENGRANEENQAAILEHRHGSVIEHVNIGVFIEGISRGLSLELNRHRQFSISQRSSRYVAEEDGAIVLDPYYAMIINKDNPTLEEASLLSQYVNALERSLAEYQMQVDQLIGLNPNKLSGFDLRKWARGKARNLLPHGLETRGTWTNNIRGWRWFIESRADVHAEAEIRRLAHHVYLALKEVAPFYFADYTVSEPDDCGLVEITTPYRKV